jgi:hypothetical protein
VDMPGAADGLVAEASRADFPDRFCLM